MTVLADAGVVDTGEVLLTAATYGRETSEMFLLRQKGRISSGKAAKVNVRDRFGLTTILNALWPARRFFSFSHNHEVVRGRWSRHHIGHATPGFLVERNTPGPDDPHAQLRSPGPNPGQDLSAGSVASPTSNASECVPLAADGGKCGQSDCGRDVTQRYNVNPAGSKDDKLVRSFCSMKSSLYSSSSLLRVPARRFSSHRLRTFLTFFSTSHQPLLFIAGSTRLPFSPSPHDSFHPLLSKTSSRFPFHAPPSPFHR